MCQKERMPASEVNARLTDCLHFHMPKHHENLQAALPGDPENIGTLTTVDLQALTGHGRRLALRISQHSEDVPENLKRDLNILTSNTPVSN